MKVIHKEKGKITKEKKQELYEMLKSVPAPSSRFCLNTAQKYWWYWFGRELIKTNSFAKLDTIHLSSAAYWLDTRNIALKFINRENKKNPDKPLAGVVQTFKGGSTNISAYVSLVSKADKALNNISEHFGLSLRDRNKLISAKEVDPDQLDIFKDFMDQKTM